MTKLLITESDLQAQCVQWFRQQYPQYADLLFAIPNGARLMYRSNSMGKRYSPEAAKLKREGMVNGVPDLMLALPNDNYPGLFIEMKSKSGKLRPDQIKMIKNLSNIGYCCLVINSLNDFIKLVSFYMEGTKGLPRSQKPSFKGVSIEGLVFPAKKTKTAKNSL